MKEAHENNDNTNTTTQEEEEQEQNEEHDEEITFTKDNQKDTTNKNNHQEEINKSTTKNKKKKKKKIHKLSLTATENFNTKLQKRGVIYLSRIPPRMGPAKLKSLLQDFDNNTTTIVTRVYLEEEDKTVRKRRQKASGTSGRGSKRYVEGWVEFEKKSDARHIATSLNMTPISNHKRNVHYGDLWCMKYLPKFEWAHLTEKVAYERRMREQKLKMEMMQARKENQAFSSLVEAGKTMDRIEERRRRRKRKGGGGDDDGGEEMEKRQKRKFRQTAPVKNDKDRAAKKTVLSSLI